MIGPGLLENDVLKVSVGVEPTLAITVTDKRNGFVWACPGPPFTLQYWDAHHFTTRCCPADHGHGWEFRVMPDEEQLAVQCTWPRAACGFRAVLEIDGPSLDLIFPGRRWVENRQSEARNMSVDVLPGFGAARTGDEGFLLLPRERGALCRFNQVETRESSMLIYADGGRGLNAPVFGIARGRAGVLGVIAQGEFDAELVVATNAGPDRSLNYVHPRLLVRVQAADPLEDADRRVRYTFLSGDADLSFVDLAKTYRSYLVESCCHPLMGERIDRRPFLDYARSAATVHVQLAEKRRTTRMTGDGELVVKTRFGEVPDLARRIREAGVERAVLVLVGWNCEGRNGLYPTRFPVESAVGGADAMAQALAGIHRLGFQVGALDNYTDMYRLSPAFDAELGAKQLGGMPWRGGTWAGGDAYVICPKQAQDRHAQRDMRRLRDLGLDGLLVLDHCPGPGVLRCYDPEHPLTRSEYARAVCDLIGTAQATFGLCRLSGIAVFAALAADSCTCPVADTPSIDDLHDDWFADESVPFLPIALHGVVLLAADADEDPLRVVEYGAAPVYHVSTGELAHVLPSLSEFCRRYTAELAPLADELIESHETHGDGLIQIGYSSGARVLINRTGQPAEIAGTPVIPQNFLVKR